MRHKWLWVIPFWIVQAAVPYVLFALILGGWPRTWSELAEPLSDSGYIISTGGTIAVLTVGQFLFLVPVRRPGLSPRATPLWVSMGVAGLACAALIAAPVLALLDGVWMIWRDRFGEAAEYWWLPLGMLLVGWLVATPLLIRFSRAHLVEDWLSRIASRLFLGTLVEAMAIIPLNVMMRKRDSCHCAHGTLWALVVCGAIGWFALGPALLLPLLAKRRKRWYRGHCGACGYDMSGCARSERCPECGSGWRAGTLTPAS